MTTMHKLESDFTKDRAANVEILLDARPDLTPKQRARLREIGQRHGLSTLRGYLADVIPPARSTPAPGRGAGPSGNAKVDTLFRIAPQSAAPDGVTVPPPGSGVLVRFSVVDAHKHIMAKTVAKVAEARAKTAPPSSVDTLARYLTG